MSLMPNLLYMSVIKLDKYEAASYKNGIFPVAEITLEDIFSFSVNWLQIILMFRVLGAGTVTGSDKAESAVALSVSHGNDSEKECYIT